MVISVSYDVGVLCELIDSVDTYETYIAPDLINSILSLHNMYFLLHESLLEVSLSKLHPKLL